MSQPVPAVEQLQVFVGPRSQYYLKRWARLTTDSTAPLGFNWAAFFLGPFWLLYRRMYSTFWITLGVVLAEEILEGLILPGGPPELLDRIISLAVATFFGVFGTHLYYAHARRKITAFNASGQIDPQLLALAGGVRWWGVLILAAVLLAGVILVLAFPQ